ncbi:MAG TPA: NAD(P)H-hydrate dehydratase [Methanobacterium sp.]|nr:NAD(P)H-hydrate dehydratase [Methanobacterium sp.]
MTPKDMMVLDANAEALGIPRHSLMESAGKCLAYKIIHLTGPCKVSIFAGVGGNGGDGFVAARYLVNKGFEVEINFLGNAYQIKSPESRINWEVIKKIEKYSELLKIINIGDSSKLRPSTADFVVDALLGTGTQGKLREPISSAVDIINRSKGIKIAVDTPSGLDPLTGKVFDKAIHADYTVTFHEEKSGFKDAKKEYVGEVHVCDIGIPRETELFTGPGDLLRLKDREKTSHKGQNGKVLVVGGSKDYSGAPALAALSALRSGVDLSVVACPSSVSSVIRSYSPDIIVRSLTGVDIGADDVDKILDLSKDVDAIIMGCGAGKRHETAETLNKVIESIDKPLVIDADTLKTLDLELLKKLDVEVVLTPHFNEFTSLFKNELQESLKNKIEAVKEAAVKSNATVILKGSVDIIAQNEKLKLNSTGNPGMTVGGTGDCLAGLIGGLIAQGHSAYEAAFLGAYINGKAGDLAAFQYGYHFKATDMLKYIPQAFKKGL